MQDLRTRISQFPFVSCLGILLQAARERKDEEILLFIRGQDCVAAEVKYHRSCLKAYTSVLYLRPSGPTQTTTAVSEAFTVKDVGTAPQACLLSGSHLEKGPL